jgi:hypothetical protein
VAESELPSEEELQEALGRVGVGDVLVNALSATASLGFHRLTAEARDLPQARLAIEALRALEPVLRDGGVEESTVRDLEQARTHLQLAYAKAVSETSGAAGEGAGGGEEKPPAQEPGRPAEQPEEESDG